MLHFFFGIKKSKKVNFRSRKSPEKVPEKYRKSQKYREKSQVKVKKRSKIGHKKVQ